MRKMSKILKKPYIISEEFAAVCFIIFITFFLASIITIIFLMTINVNGYDFLFLETKLYLLSALPIVVYWFMDNFSDDSVTCLEDTILASVIFLLLLAIIMSIITIMAGIVIFLLRLFII